jgi:hypothetical protein
MTAVTPSYGTLATVVITIASLGSDSALTSGRNSTVIDNSSICAVDTHVAGYITLGTGLATITKQVEFYFYGSNDASNFAGGLTSADAASNVCAGKKSDLQLVAVLPTENVATSVRKFGPWSVAQKFGGTMPKYWGVFVAQNTCGALFSTSGSHELTYMPIHYASA